MQATDKNRKQLLIRTASEEEEEEETFRNVDAGSPRRAIKTTNNAAGGACVCVFLRASGIEIHQYLSQGHSWEVALTPRAVREVSIPSTCEMTRLLLEFVPPKFPRKMSILWSVVCHLLSRTFQLVQGCDLFVGFADDVIFPLLFNGENCQFVLSVGR